MSLQITVNGTPTDAPDDATIGSWLHAIGRDPRVVAVERNGEIVPRARFAETPLADGDRLEIVQFVQGG
ncbi:MAG: sulfur carrier protein ThiS [Acidobacteriota bacterium]